MKPSPLILTIRTLMAVVVAISFVVLVAALVKDSYGISCQGIMGASVTCFRVTLAFYVLPFGGAIVGILAAILIVDYMSKSQNESKVKSSKNKVKSAHRQRK